MEKGLLLKILTGEENPKFITARENVIIDKFLQMINDKEAEIQKLESEKELIQDKFDFFCINLG